VVRQRRRLRLVVRTLLLLVVDELLSLSLHRRHLHSYRRQPIHLDQSLVRP
jgi:hypothetical protein